MKSIQRQLSLIVLASCIVTPLMSFAHSNPLQRHCPDPKYIQLVKNDARTGQYMFMTADLEAVGLYISFHSVINSSLSVTRFKSARIIGNEITKDINPTECSYTISNHDTIHMHALAGVSAFEDFQPSSGNWQKSGQGYSCIAGDAGQCTWNVSKRPFNH